MTLTQNRPVHLWYGNGVETRYEYDENGNLTLLETKQGEEVLLSFAYEYDGNGNRISREGSEGKVFYSYNEKNQLICEEGRQGKRLFTYSPQGSILKEEGPKGIRSYDYNSKNQQIRVTLEDGRVQKNRYDAEGLRYETCEEEKRLRFVYHEGELLYEEGGEEARSYHLGLGIEAVSRGEGISCYHRDEQRSTALMTGAGVENAYLYDAFGAEVKALEQRENRIRYTGQQYDGVTEQYYLRARYYNPVLGRFLQEDVYQGDGLNLYAYCKNNPVMYWDPSGYAKKPGSGCPPNAKINEDGGRTGESSGEEPGKVLNSFDDVAEYIQKNVKLPDNFITKEQAKALGWSPKKGNLAEVAPGKSIGGNIFKNSEGKLPSSAGRTWYEADINYSSGFRGDERILYSNDGLIYKTTNHYETFTQINK